MSSADEEFDKIKSSLNVSQAKVIGCKAIKFGVDNFIIWDSESNEIILRSPLQVVVDQKFVMRRNGGRWNFNGVRTDIIASGRFGEWSMKARDSNDNNTNYIRVREQVRDNTDGAEKGGRDNQVIITNNEFTASVQTIQKWQGNGEAYIQDRIRVIATDPTVTELPDSNFGGLFKNSVTSKIWLAVNDGGTIKKVELV